MSVVARENFAQRGNRKQAEALQCLRTGPRDRKPVKLVRRGGAA